MTSSTGSLLQSIQILVTGVPEKEKRRLHDIAKTQGAVILSTANANDPPHVVITRTVGSPRYFTILKRNSGIPIVTPEWLTSSIEKGTRLPYAEFAAGVFQGLVICFSGLSVAEKKELSQQVESQGGRHSPVLDRSCTHLVTDSTQSDKFIYAQLHGIYCITPAWIEDSLSAGWCKEPTKYLVTKPVSQQQHSQQHNSLLARQASLQRGQNTSASGLTDKVTNTTDSHNFNQQHQPQQHQLNLDASGKSGSDGIVGVKKILVDASGGRGTIGVEPKPSSRLGNAGAATAVAEFDAPISATPADATPWATLDHEDDAPLFLDSCFVWVTCCSPAEELETLALCAKGGAKRFLEPHPKLTTHVVVGSNLVGSNSDAVASFISEHKDVPVVGLEWLRRSVARRENLAADERFTVSVPSSGSVAGAGLLGHGGSMTLHGFQSNDSNSLPVALLNTAANGGGGADGGGASGSGSAFFLNRQNSGASLMGGFLDNCYFTLAAVRGTPEGDAAERIIRMHGGRLFSTSVPTSGKACFAICPYSLPSHTLHALRANHPDFAAVPEAQRFTLWWLECCVQAGEVLPHQAGTACFQPLPFTLPLKDMDKVSVSISGYEPSVRAAIQRTVEIVGGRVSLEYMTAKDTHLIVPVAQGKKYKYAGQYGVIPVTAAWLLESVKAGKALPPDNFAPLLPTGGVAAATTVAVDTSQQQQQQPLNSSLPPIGPTQQSLPQQRGGTTTSLYAAAIAGPAAMKQQPLNNAKPTLKQKAQRLREAAKRSAAGMNATSNTTAIPLSTAAAVLPTKKSAATAFDFDSLMGPLQKNKTGSGGASGSRAIASAAIASIVAPAPHRPSPIVNDDDSGRFTRLNQAPAAAPIQPETEGAAELDAALNQVSSLLDRMKGRGGVLAGNGSGHSSQQDMPPPPARGAGAGGSEGGTGRGKRSRGVDDGTTAPRRSTRGGGGGGVISGISELMESEGIEMSQQVGYESAAVEVEEVTAPTSKDGGHAAARAAFAAKERLTRAATRNRRGQTTNRDTLDGF